MTARTTRTARTAGHWVRTVRWYLRELTGEAEYDRYCERHRRHHPKAPVPTRRQYEWMRTTRRECESPGRCC